jgi:hypothetical protein
MKNALLPALALATAGALAGFLPRADSLVLAPTEGLVLERSFEETSERSLAEVSVIVNGDEQEVGEIPEVVMSFHAKMVMTDEVAEAADGRATRFVRSFDEVYGSRTIENPDGVEEMDRQSPLQEETVAFTWDADAEEYSAAWADEESDLDPEMLEPLNADLDLAFFLPGGEVSEGDSWEVDGAEFVVVSFLSDHVGLEEDEEMPDEQMEVQDEILAQLQDTYAGAFECTYAGTRDEEGRTAGVITITGEIETVAEHSFEPEEEGGPESVSLGLEYTAVYEGELLWDVEGGHMMSLSLIGEVELSESQVIAGPGPDGSTFELEQAQVYEGEITWSVMFTAAGADE